MKNITKRFFVGVLAVIMLMTLVGCKDKPSTGLDAIDFENGTLNVDDTEIRKYVEGNGYTDYRFTFDVEKQIYSCEVYLPDTKQIEVDGEGYESFISEVRPFLTQGTKVMAEVLSEHNVSGISSGMVIATSEGVMLCVAMDGSVSYVAHVKDDAVTTSQLSSKIKNIVSEFIEGEIAVTIDTVDKIVNVSYTYESQQQENVSNAFAAAKEYMASSGLGGYLLFINGNNGQPSAGDKTDAPATTTNILEILPVPDEIGYDLVGTFISGYPVFKVVSTSENAESKSTTVINELKQVFGDERFCFYVVDSDNKFLGNGNNDGYEPYVFREFCGPHEVHSAMIPFDYYMVEYFSGINYNGTTFHNFGRNQYNKINYEFIIERTAAKDKSACESAINNLGKAMELALGDEVKVSIQVKFKDSNDVLTYETPDPQK